MAKYLFVLGRNVELSKAEVFCYLEREGIKIFESKIIGNGLFVNLDGNIDGGVVDDLGGVIAIGIVLCDVKGIGKTEIYFGEKNNITYCLHEFNPLVDIRSYLKSRFREEKLKASEKPLGNFIEMQSGESIRNVSRGKLIDEQYFVFESYFGKVIQKSNYKEIEKRDMEKPFRRSDLAISPRLSKIMINLSKVRKGEKLLDPFCGVGVILQEALLQEINVIGIEIDKDVLEKAQKNLEWGKFSKENYKLICNDSRKASIGKVDGVATEPDLGETLRKIPDEKKADSIIKEYENLMQKVLENLEKYVSGRIVFTAPFIKTRKNRVSCSIQMIAGKTKFKVVEGFPMPEYRENQIVGRQIYVLER